MERLELDEQQVLAELFINSTAVSALRKVFSNKERHYTDQSRNYLNQDINDLHGEAKNRHMAAKYAAMAKAYGGILEELKKAAEQ